MTPLAAAAVLCGASNLVGGVEAPRAFEVTLQPSFAATIKGVVHVVAAPVGRDSGIIRVPVTTPGRDAVRLPIDGVWRIGCEGQGVWCPTYVVQSSEARDGLTLPLFAACRLSGRLLPPRGRPLPETVTLQGSVQDRGGRAIVEFTTNLAVDRRGRFETTVPRARLDLRLAPEGFAPAYRWDVATEGRMMDLGALDLRRGGSVTGTVVDYRTAEGIGGAAVTLVPAGTGAGTLPGEGTEAYRRIEATTSGPGGFFQIAGLLPGRYRMELLKGRSTASLDDVDVREDAETELGSVALQDPVQLEVVVSPAIDAQGSPWTVRLSEEVPGRPGSEEVSTDEEGIARFPRLRAGRYSMIVSDRAGSQLAFRRESVLTDTRVTVEVPLVEVVGSIHLGDQPLVADVTVQTGSADRREFRSDEQGRFGGRMRRPDRGFLMVDVSAAEPLLRRVLDFFDLDLQGSILYLDVRVDDLALAGRVIDETGNPVPGALVWADAPNTSVQRVSSDGEGQFRIQGLEAKRYTVYAEDRRGTSEPIEIDASTRFTPPEAVLVLREGRVVEGTVFSAEGAPVPAAAVTIEVPGGAPVSTSTTTDAGGRFKARAGPGATHALVRVRAPSQVLWSGCQPLPEEGPITIVLPPRPGGTLETRSTFDPKAPPARGGRLLLLTHEGGSFGPSDLLAWRMALGGPLLPARVGEAVVQTLPNVAPGRYTIAWSSLPWWELSRQLCAGGLLLGLDSGIVTPGGQTTLAIDVREYQRKK